MNRLRVRVELNRRKTGVPLDELVSVVDETRKFFHLLAEDVQIPVEQGTWHASNFDPESLNFTAEYSGPASAEQIRAFGSAFGGATSLRRETIAQFTHIADFIGEDELVGFGLYQSDQESEPSDWRCLSRRDALRFADEIRLLAKATGESVVEAPLPAVMNGSVGGRRLFKDRRERETLAIDPSKWIRDVESSLSRRISLLENQVESQARQLHGLGNTQEAADERFLKLLGAMESFWSQAPRQLPAMTPDPRIRELANLSADSHAAAREPSPPPGKWKSRLALIAAGLILAAAGISVMAGKWPRLAKPTNLSGIAKPASASLIRSSTDISKTPPTKTESGPSESGSAPSLPDISPPIQVKQSQSDTRVNSSRQDTGVEMMRQISLEVPPDLKGIIKEQVLINVMVDVDQKGKVVATEVVSTKGEEGGRLAAEALKAARWFHFRPSRQRGKNKASQTVLSFVFDPDTEVLLHESTPRGNP